MMFSVVTQNTLYVKEWVNVLLFLPPYLDYVGLATAASHQYHGPSDAGTNHEWPATAAGYEQKA